MRLRTILSLLLAFCAPAVVAQTLTIGNPYLPWPGFGVGTVKGVTFVDLVHPATASGTLTEASITSGSWADECSGGAKIKFFRRDGLTLTMIAERGPFNVSWNDGTMHLPLTPPVRVLAGDLIGVVDLMDCCGGFMLSPWTTGQYMAFPADVTGTVQVSAGKTAGGTLLAYAAGEVTGEVSGDESTARIIPVVGSTDGVYGSEWKTSVQLLNPHSVPVSGRLVFRTSRISASSADPSIEYSLAAGVTQTIADIGAAIARSGVGSLDVTTMTGGLSPVVVAHIRHAGFGGAFGFTEEAVDPNEVSSESPDGSRIGSRVLNAGVTGFLIAPRSAEERRFNIGVRSLASGATFSVTLRSWRGETLQTRTMDFPPHYFDQFSANDLFGRDLYGTNLMGGESIAVSVLRGSAIVYGSAIDNVTNDPSIQYAVGFVPRKAQ